MSYHHVITPAFHNLLATFAIFWQLFGIFYNFRRLLVSKATFANYWYLFRISNFWQHLPSFGNFCHLLDILATKRNFFYNFWYLLATFVNCFHILATLRNFSLLANFATFGISKLNLIFGIFWQLVQDLGTFQNFSHFCHILVTFATLLHFLPHLGTFCHIFAIFGSFPQFLTTIGIFWQLLSCFCNF